MTTETTTCEECANMRAFGFVAAEVDADHERGHPDWCADQVSAAPSATNDGWFDRVSGSLKGELGTDDEFLAATAETSFHQVVPGTERAAHSASHKCVRCQRTAAETGATHILNGTCAGWACFPECPPAAPSPSAPEVEERLRELKVLLAPHRRAGTCPMTGEQDCCDTLVIEERLLLRVAALSDSLRVAREERDAAQRELRGAERLDVAANEQAKRIVRGWIDAVMAHYPMGWAFDPTCPRLMVDNVVRNLTTKHEESLAALRRTQEEDTRAIIVGEVCEDCAAHVRACCPDALAARTTAPTGEEAP